MLTKCPHRVNLNRVGTWGTVSVKDDTTDKFKKTLKVGGTT